MQRSAGLVARPAAAIWRRQPLGGAGSLLVGLVVVCSLLLGACRGPQQDYTSLGPHAFPLRAQFNHDAGKVRIAILPAPN